jgi:hypothetical protein
MGRADGHRANAPENRINDGLMEAAMLTVQRHFASNHLAALVCVTGAILLLLTGCDATSADVTATVARATSTSDVSAPADTSQQTAPAEAVTATVAAPVPAEATEPPSQTQTPPPTAQATSTTRPTATNTPTPAPTRAIPPTPNLQQLAAQNPQIAALLNNPAVSMAYKEVIVAYQQGGTPAAMAIARQRGLLSPDGSMILSTLTVSSSDTAVTVAGLKAMGIQVLGVQGNQINIAVSIAQLLGSAQQPGALLTQMLAVPNVTSVLPPMR